MLSYIALLPGIAAFLLATRHNPQYAFFRVYLPVLLFLPDYYRCIFPGLPDPTFNQSACVALFISFVMRGFPGYRFSLNDLWVIGYAACASISEYRATNYSDAQNLMFGMLFSGVVPYILAKSLIEPFGNRFLFAKTCVLAMSAVSILNLIELRLGTNPWQLLFSRFFPGQGYEWVTTFRFGLARSSGPYAHALLAGIMMIVAFRLQRWLQWSGAWPDKFRLLPWLPYKPAFWLSLITAGGLFITLAKGSWLAAVFGAGLVTVGRRKYRRKAMGVILAAMVVIGIPAFIAFLNYASVGRENAKDANQETAAYRYELVEHYIDIANQQPWWGWGLTHWPKVPGAESIDNYFLLLLLMHGYLASAFFLLLLLGTMVRLLIYGLRQPATAPPGSSLAFTLAGIYLGYFVVIATVFMGQQTVPMFFMLTGWAESYMQRHSLEWAATGVARSRSPSDGRPFRFRRVL